MENILWEKISCKYILKQIFSYLKVIKALKIIKPSEKIRARLDISLYHYQQYNFFVSLKKVKIERIEDILESPTLKIFPEDTKNELILKYIKVKKLFCNEHLYLNIDDKNIISLLKKLGEKHNNTSFKYIIGNIEEKRINEDLEKNYHNNISKIIEMDKNNVDKILFDFNHFFHNSILNEYCLNVKYLFINVNANSKYDISLFKNLEYLSIQPSKKSNLYEIKIILSETQFKKIKTLKIIEPEFDCNPIKRLFFETANNDSKYFENLNELYVKEKLINTIKLFPTNLQKLNISYDFRDYPHNFIYARNSINKICHKYSSLISLNVFFYNTQEYYCYNNTQMNPQIPKLIFDSVYIENFSLNFLDGNYYEKYLHFIFKKCKNQKSKFQIKNINNNNPFIIFESLFDKIEHFEFFFYNNYALNIEKDNSISTLNYIKINEDKGFLKLPMNDFSSLQLLHLNNIQSYPAFPLFLQDSAIKFENLEYLKIYPREIQIIYAIINNFANIPNLRFLCIYHKYFSDSVFPYERLIISKCELLKKLDILIIDTSNNAILKKAIQYYSIYPELKKTTIRFCHFIENLKK